MVDFGDLIQNAQQQIKSFFRSEDPGVSSHDDLAFRLDPKQSLSEVENNTLPEGVDKGQLAGTSKDIAEAAVKQEKGLAWQALSILAIPLTYLSKQARSAKNSKIVQQSFQHASAAFSRLNPFSEKKSEKTEEKVNEFIQKSLYQTSTPEGEVKRPQPQVTPLPPKPQSENYELMPPPTKTNVSTQGETANVGLPPRPIKARPYNKTNTPPPGIKRPEGQQTGLPTNTVAGNPLTGRVFPKKPLPPIPTKNPQDISTL